MRIGKIHYTSDFRTAYLELPEKMRKIVDRKDAMFRKNPFHPNLKTHKLRGRLSNLWSFWITYNYRILFEFTKDGAIFYDVGTHEIYR